MPRCFSSGKIGSHIDNVVNQVLGERGKEFNGLRSSEEGSKTTSPVVENGDKSSLKNTGSTGSSSLEKKRMRINKNEINTDSLECCSSRNRCGRPQKSLKNALEASGIQALHRTQTEMFKK